MTQHRNLNYNDRFPEAWADAIQEFISTLHSNFAVTQVNSTTLQIVAGADNAQVCVGINGRWRYNAATVNAAHPGGAAATYDIYVTASDNVFTPSGLPAGQNPEVDNTVYSFALAIRAVGNPPVTALYRKIGTCVWDGAAITDFTITVGSSRHHQAHEPGGSDPFNLATIAPVIHASGTLGARPAASATNLGYLYLATDNLGGTIYRSTGSAWVQLAAGVVHAAVHLPGGADSIAWDATVHARGTLGTRPAAAAGNLGLFYFATDSAGGTLYRSTGSAWEAVAAGVTAALAPAAHAASHAPGGTDALPWGSIHGYGTLGARPAAGSTNTGYLYFATDTSIIYRSNGTTWDTLSASNTGIAAAILLTGTLGARPAAAAGNTGFYYYATDTFALAQSTGAAWTAITPTPGDATVTQAKFAAGAAAGQSYGTAFPTTGLYNGYRFTLFVTNPSSGSSGGDYIYRADIDGTYPWHSCGEGVVLTHYVQTSNSINTQGTYTNLGTVGPQIPLVRAGYWEFVYSMRGFSSPVNASDKAYMAYALTGGSAYAAQDGDALIVYSVLANIAADSSGTMMKVHAAIAAGTTITSQYRQSDTSGAATCFFSERKLRARLIKGI